MPVWSELERMVMFDIYYHNQDKTTYEDFEDMFYKDQTVRMIYAYNFWDNKLVGEDNHAV